MGLSFTDFTPLIDSSTGIFCHLLQIDETKIIIDCGINESFDYSIYDSVKSLIESSDCILLTSFDLLHIGAVGLFPDIPVYCSIPTAILGRIILDNHKSIIGDQVVNSFNPKQIKFLQPFKINETEIVSYNSGFTLGNSAYKITTLNQSIGISYNLNHRKENFIDGFNHLNFENIDVFITNSGYVDSVKTTIKKRDETLVKLFNSFSSILHDSKLIITVSFTRLLELLAIIHKQDVLLISPFAKLFIERTKAMFEWAGAKADENTLFSNIKYGYISEIKNHNIIIVVDENTDGYLGTVLDQLNTSDHSLLLLDRKAADFNPEILKVYTFEYNKVEVKKVLQKTTGESESISEDNDLDHWSLRTNTIFCDDYPGETLLFPTLRKRRQINPYGETINFEFEKKEEIAHQEPPLEKIQIVESKSLIKTGIIPLFNMVEGSIPGISDPCSFKTIIESFSPKKIVLVNDFPDFAKFLSTNLQIGRNKIESIICDRKLRLKAYKSASKSLVCEEIMNLEFKRILNKKISKFIAKRSSNLIEYNGDYSKFTIGKLDLNSIKRSLIESGYQVESFDNQLLVNGILKLIQVNNELRLESDSADLACGVRKVLYNFITII